MRLLDNVRLIESEVLAPPTASSAQSASYEHSDSWTKLCNSSWEHDRKPLLEESHGKIADFFGETRFGQGQESELVSVEHRTVGYNQSHAAGYPKIGCSSHRAWNTLDRTMTITVVFIGCMRLLDNT